MQPASEAERIALLPEADRARWWARMTGARRAALDHDWSFWRRDDQIPPRGNWHIWFVMAGRGFGKTRMAAEWVRAQAEADGGLRIALVAATLHEARTVMIEGESGLLTIAPDLVRPIYEPSLRRLTWPNGAIATLYSAAEPEALRGPQHHIAWGDEVAKWVNGVDTWDNLAMTMRMGDAPRIIATTTPRPVPLVKRLLTAPDVALTEGPMHANRAHLPRVFRDAVISVYGGTRLGRQEIEGIYLEGHDGALWTRERIDECRIRQPPPLVRVVIGVDPPASSSGDACGIVAVGLGEDGRGYVLGDHSVDHASPARWAAAVTAAATQWRADRVIAESNNGGEMVETTLRAADINLPIKRVHASHGKVARAEPVSLLYEQGRVSHAGAFPELEDQLCGIAATGYEGPDRSPDRADALVWALTELMLGKKGAKARVVVL